MTHFVGLVVAETKDELGALLQPFHEYECTGLDDQYVVDVDETDILRIEFTSYGDEGQSFEDFVQNWGNYTLRDGRYYQRTNPNAQWDWWVVGGRWGDMVPNHNCLVEQIPEFFNEGWTPKVLVDADGWHASETYGWFGFSQPTNKPDATNQKLIQHAGKRVWIVDFHI